jgi:hypothetical protein
MMGKPDALLRFEPRNREVAMKPFFVALNDPIDASPIAVGHDLFLRSKSRLYCISRDGPSRLAP